VAALAASDPNYRNTGAWPTSPLLFVPREANRWVQLRAACPENPGWSATFTTTPVVFMHELRHPQTGQRRLVCVTHLGFCSWWDAAQSNYLSGENFVVERIRPAGLRGSPEFLGEGIYVETQRRAAKPNTADTQFPDPQNPPDVIQRIYAGQLDPDDPSHFTISYDTPAGPRTLDGRLAADGESVSLELRSR
jgi:hypothetical protein